MAALRDRPGAERSATAGKIRTMWWRSGPRGSVMPEGVAVVREIDVRAGAGGGGVVASAYGFTKDGKNGDSVRERWGLPMSFVAGELRATSTNLDIIEVMGDSMEPTLSSGDRVVVDKSQTKPSPDGIFVLWDGYGVIVKRVEVIRGRTPAAIRVISDNKLHGAVRAGACGKSHHRARRWALFFADLGRMSPGG